MKPAKVLVASMLLSILSSVAYLAAEEAFNPVEMIGAFEGTYGVHPGQRRNHIKGTCAVGEFIGTADGARYSRSALFSGQPVPVIARFSLGGGNPNQSDAAKGVQGMALQFKLPDGGLQHMTMINVPVFLATPEAFRDLLLASKPDPATKAPNPEAFKAFVAKHPDFNPFGAAIQGRNAFAGYDTSFYNSLHAFWFVDKNDKKTLVRWHFEPVDGVKNLTDEEAKKAPSDFLEQALIARTQKSPAKWDMYITLGQPGDAETDPSQVWPADRERVKVGTLSITQAMAQKDGICGPINFDPVVVADGIQITDDPVLKARSATYAISFGKRMSGQ
ncbi:catalase family peroxidase [Metapseudomonas resinovorans]|uniref:Catalase-related peroxidase n=1 Tax=Metapseudomonas resinovorans NBRC 106553 TaxID=1245471 RepID=S6ARZ7_METRE|nr:catalase family peroxidase [Pseudomonas resinovorans]BAN48753.1 putative catalase [Pseudomonas resinovorans NBRC 106553]